MEKRNPNKRPPIGSSHQKVFSIPGLDWLILLDTSCFFPRPAVPTCPAQISHTWGLLTFHSVSVSVHVLSHVRPACAHRPSLYCFSGFRFCGFFFFFLSSVCLFLFISSDFSVGPSGKRNTARPQSRQALEAEQLFSNQKRSEQVVWQAMVKTLKTQNQSNAAEGRKKKKSTG